MGRSTYRVTIGDGAVIGAGAVVTHDVGPYEIWAGVPAKKIGQRFGDNVKDHLIEKGGWWDLPIEFLKTDPEMFKQDVTIEMIDEFYEKYNLYN